VGVAAKFKSSRIREAAGMPCSGTVSSVIVLRKMPATGLFRGPKLGHKDCYNFHKCIDRYRAPNEGTHSLSL
jgi:hypothetical protein